MSCAESDHKNNKQFFIDKPEITSGEILKINSYEEIDSRKDYEVQLVNSRKEIIESYFPVVYNNYFVINRFLNHKINSLENYSILIKANNLRQEIPIQIMPSVIIESFCGENNCNALSGNVLEGISNTIEISYGQDWLDRADESKSVMVGDRDVDMAAASEFGVRGLRCDPNLGLSHVVDLILEGAA